MRTRLFAIAFAVVAALIAAPPVQADSILDFEDGTDEGFGTGFGNDASASWPVESRGGSLRMRLTPGGFQTAGRETSNPLDPVYLDLDASSNGNEGIWRMAYDWYIDTSEIPPGQAGTFLQLGTYMNTGNGYYAQDFPAVGKDVELTQAQLESGLVFSGTVDETLAAKGYDIPPGQTFFRPGVIVNGDGAGRFMHIDNIRLYVPEPGSVVLMALAVPVLALVVCRRRK